ncbi:hypothetical protein P7B02_10650 [Caulobacter segnis]|uniref:hypothetical protein n=1 Tax=Caulobacter segnis TaxID=88688 RepID=UPI00240EE3C7|nr:hypothetical protein [Caulobacter segnis]MDG2521997.1 hypothetical protein [Caulobacter segnis]
MSDADLVQRQTDYVQTLRTMGKRERTLGLVASLIGVLMLMWATYRGEGARSLLGFSGVGVVALGWVLFVSVVVRRARFVRSNPFPQS